MMKKTKGISPLIASVLLIAIVIVVGTLTLDWATAIHSNLGSSVKNKTSECTTAAVVIDRVYLDLNGSVGRIVARNSGFDDDSITGASVVTMKGQTSSNLTAFPVAMARGTQTTLTVNISGIITSCTNFSRAYVTTSCGVSAEYGVGESPTCTN
ncbi:MAG: hypothetical protein HY364_04550 [Candidatus Aenigmarchaeota archaeon]|nr:hypothetical protein [Candidatus Aenigmarchaeota archaeon]